MLPPNPEKKNEENDLKLEDLEFIKCVKRKLYKGSDMREGKVNLVDLLSYLI